MATSPVPQPNGLLTKLVAALIERTCKNYVTTIVSVGGALALTIPIWAHFLPQQYWGDATYVTAFILAVVGALAKDK